jgi:hypothetical protein
MGTTLALFLIQASNMSAQALLDESLRELW